MLGCWQSFFLPLAQDPQLSDQAKELRKALSKRGVAVSEKMLKVCCFFFSFLGERSCGLSCCLSTVKPHSLSLRLCFQLLTLSLKKILKDLDQDFPRSGTWPVIIFSAQQCLSSQRERRPKVTWF